MMFIAPVNRAIDRETGAGRVSDSDLEARLKKFPGRRFREVKPGGGQVEEPLLRPVPSGDVSRLHPGWQSPSNNPRDGLAEPWAAATD